jgi:hypothetical protein
VAEGAVRVAQLPAHIEIGPEGETVGVDGNGFTVTMVAAEAALRHPFALVT